MNLYLRTLGFSRMDSRQERKFIQSGIKQCMEEGFVLRHDGFSRGVIILQISASTGIYIYGRFEGKRFIYEYYFPFVIGKRSIENDELSVERHVDKESYAVVCDEMLTGTTFIFYLQNVMDYLEYISGNPGFKPEMFLLDRRNSLSKSAIKGKRVSLTALSLGGMILLPINKNVRNSKKNKEAERNRHKLIAAAKNGDEDAIESLTIDDIDMYTQISQRILYEDVFTIVDSTFMPCGVECDQYSVIGEILELSTEDNLFTGEKIYIMVLECNDLIFTMAINREDLVGEPKPGRRFKGQIWLQGAIQFGTAAK